MANVDRPNGFKPYGAPLRINVYQAAGTIYPGDLVTAGTGGTIASTAAGTSSAIVLGAAAGYGVSGDLIPVYDDPEQLFVAQADDASITAITSMFGNYAIIDTAGSSTYKASRQEVDASSLATTATLPIKVLKMLDRSDNALGDSVKLVCKINSHFLGNNTASFA